MPLAISPGMASAAKRLASPRGRNPSGVDLSGPIHTAHATSANWHNPAQAIEKATT